MFTWIFSLVVSSILFTWAAAAPARQPEATGDAKTTITSKRMTVKNQESRAIFEGAVVLTRGPLVVHSDVMVVTFQSTGVSSDADQAKIPEPCRGRNGASAEASRPSADPKVGESLPAVSNRSICLMEATGHVIIEKDEGRATSRKAVYYVNERKIVLTGDPVACQRGTRVSGEKITMYLEEDRSEVEGGSQVMINPEGGRC